MEGTPLYEMYKDDTMDAGGGVADKSEDDEIHVMDTGLGR